MKFNFWKLIFNLGKVKRIVAEVGNVFSDIREGKEWRDNLGNLADALESLILSGLIAHDMSESDVKKAVGEIKRSVA